jgi:3-hydroxyisobutyrate dehydrogenase-like beta-hydroxyacid dehydrogenase
MVGGDAATFEGAAPVLGHYGRAVTLMGGPGSGQLTKMFNQICIAGLVQALAEGIAFAEKAGLDVERALEVISKGAAQSWQMEKPRQDDDRQQIRLRLCRRLDAQGPRAVHV